MANGSFLFTALLDAEKTRANAQGAKSFPKSKTAGDEEEDGGNGDGGEEKGEAPMQSVAESVVKSVEKIVALDEEELLAGLKQMALAQSSAHARATFRRLVRLGPSSTSKNLTLDPASAYPRPTFCPSSSYPTTTSSPSSTQGSTRNLIPNPPCAPSLLLYK